MPEELYADTITGIAITGTVVRIDFASLAPTDDASQQPKPVFRQRVIMPVEGFVQSFATMARVMQELEKKGVLRRGEPGHAPGEVTVKPAADRGPGGR